MKLNLVIIISILFLFAVKCTNENSVTIDNEVEKIDIVKSKSDNSVADIIRSPVSGEQEIDSTKSARMIFKETSFDFGDLKEGKTVEHTFKFKNTGKTPLIISNVSSTCGCTIPLWPKTPIAPGETSEINVKFNSKGKNGKQQKPITIIANTYPNKTKLIITANVKK